MADKLIAKTEMWSELDGSAPFAHVLVGVDGSPESREAVRQAALLATGDLTILSAWDVPPPVVGGMNSTYVRADETPHRARAEKALEKAREVVGPLVPVEKIGVAVGRHGQGRMRGIVIGSTATEVVHKAPCSVLVTRKAGPRFPERVVVGVDGSSESAAAYAVAEQLAGRFDAELWPVVAHRGKGVDETLVRRIVDRREDLQDEPVRALVAASAEADLVVVGSPRPSRPEGARLGVRARRSPGALLRARRPRRGAREGSVGPPSLRPPSRSAVLLLEKNAAAFV